MYLRRILAAVFLAAVLFLSGCSSISTVRRETPVPRGVVVLTFDDGPNAHGDTTARLLDVLQKNEARAMFALLGENARQHPELVRRIAREGHMIINHGEKDDWAVFMDDEEFLENLRRAEEALCEALGGAYTPKLYRPQGGFYCSRHRALWEQQGYTLVPATARAYDAVKDAGGKDIVVKRIVEAVEEEDGGIIMLHDSRDSHTLAEKELAEDPYGVYNRAWIPEAAEEIIRILREKGFTFGLYPR